MVTLTCGTALVNTTAVTNSSLIFLTVQSTRVIANLGTEYISGLIGGTGFGINSTNILDTATIAWKITDMK